MCNIAGYIGKERAAPVLLEMMEKQEGFGGGYYTGIATVHRGRLHWAKVVGDVAELRRNTRAERLPGTTGIIHARPNMKGGREWAHPFVATDGRFAYMANGHAGFFEDEDRDTRLLRDLAMERFPFLSYEGDAYDPEAVTTEEVHASEVMCRSIERWETRRGGILQAMQAAFAEKPGELATLLVHREHPDTIFATRISQPLMLGAGQGAFYLATTAMAFPGKKIDWLSPAPPLTTLAVNRGNIENYPLTPLPRAVADTFPWKAGEERVLRELKSGSLRCVQDFKDATASLWPSSAAPQKDMMVYEILRRLQEEGRIGFRTVWKRGKQPGLRAPSRRAFLRK